MFGNFILDIGYTSYLQRHSIPASPEAEAAYRAQTDANRRQAKIDEARRHVERQAHIASLPITPMPFVKAGRLRESTSGGSIVHSVMSNGVDGGMNGSHPREALCGDAPKIGWSRAEGHDVNCPKCLRRMPS